MSIVKKTNRTLPSVFSDMFDSFMDMERLENGYSNFMPAVNISENENNFEIDFSVPGYDKKDFNVEVDDDTLIVSAEHKTERSEDESNFTKKEFSYGSFQRSFTLPDNIEEEKVDASYKDGILKITLPKNDKAKVKSPKQIDIK